MAVVFAVVDCGATVVFNVVEVPSDTMVEEILAPVVPLVVSCVDGVVISSIIVVDAGDIVAEVSEAGISEPATFSLAIVLLIVVVVLVVGVVVVLVVVVVAGELPVLEVESNDAVAGVLEDVVESDEVATPAVALDAVVLD